MDNDLCMLSALIKYPSLKGWTLNSIQDFVGIRMSFGQAMNGVTTMVINKQSRSPLLILKRLSSPLQLGVGTVIPRKHSLDSFLLYLTR